ncbi:unnamed protein product, partial [Ectocarpus fasciculatus]
ILDEVGDGACLLRAISRKAFGDPANHAQVRQAIVQHIQDNPGTFYAHISNGFGNEPIRIQGSPPSLYYSLQDYLSIMAQPSAYGGYIEIAAASQLYGLTIEVVIAGTPF